MGQPRFLAAVATVRPVSDSTTHPPYRSSFLRVLGAQEAGLVIVIALMTVAFTLACPSIERYERTALPADAVVDVSDAGRIAVASGDERRIYERARGWDLSEVGTTRFLVRVRIVDKFLNKENLVGVAKDASFIAIMAVGVTGIIILGGIDLSIGSVYALAAILGALALHALEARSGTGVPWHVSLPVGVGVCGAAGAACGAMNGLATVGLRVHPFIITLGGMAVYRGVAFVITRGQSVGEFPDSYTTGAFKATIGGVNPVPMAIMLVVGVVGALVLHFTTFGRRTFAIGGNETAARYAGIPVGRVKVLWYALGGLLTGLAAAVFLGYYGGASSDAGSGYELSVIAAAVVGGASLSGGRGSALGAMLGAIVIQLIANGIVVLGVDSNYTNIVIGLAIVVAVVVDQAKARVGRR